MKLKSMQIKKEGGFEMKKTNKKALSSLAISIILLLQLFTYNVIALEDDTFIETELISGEMIVVDGISEEIGDEMSEEDDEELMPMAAAAGCYNDLTSLMNDQSSNWGFTYNGTGPGSNMELSNGYYYHATYQHNEYAVFIYNSSNNCVWSGYCTYKT